MQAILHYKLPALGRRIGLVIRIMTCHMLAYLNYLKHKSLKYKYEIK